MVGTQTVMCKFILILASLLVVIGLAVGLGVGLTVGRESDNNVDDSSAVPSATATPAPWQPAVSSTWQIVLENAIELPSTSKSVSPSVPVYDIDMFDNEKEVMDTLHDLGVKVICYFDAGSYEPGRPDSKDFKKKDLGKELEGWPGEYWLNISSPDVRDIMSNRIKIAESKGCDAIDPDNVDGYDNKNGLGLTAQDSIDYMHFLAGEAKARGMSTGLKNAGEIISKVLPVVSFSVNEQCHYYQECETFSPFIKAGKPVFNIEYPGDSPKITAKDIKKYCATSGTWGTGAAKFSTVLKNMDLDGFVEYCDGKAYNTPLNTN